MINKNLARLVLNEGLKTGADFAELFYEETKSHSITLENGEVDAINATTSTGVGIRLLQANRSVYGFTNEISKKSLLALVNRLTPAFNAPRCKTITEFHQQKIKNISPIEDSYFLVSNEEKINILKSLHQAAKNYSPLVTRTTCIMPGVKNHIEIYNSDGLYCKDDKERVRLCLEVFASDGDRHERIISAPGERAGMKYIRSLDLNKIANETAEDAVSALSAKECPSGKMPVIIGNGFGGVLFHEACGHSLEAVAIAHNSSVFTNRKGEQIASPIVNAYDDATIPHAWGSNNIDDEGTPTQRICLIKNGILNDYLVDNFNGRRINAKGNGCCRRESYKYEPTSRMSNTFIDNGTTLVEEIIKSTKLGLYAKRLNGGTAMPATGEFEFAVDVGYIIRDGKICERVRGATLIGKGEDVLKNIDMIGNDLSCASGFCGASSGYVPNEIGQPTIRVKEMVVGGKGGKLV